MAIHIIDERVAIKPPRPVSERDEMRHYSAPVAPKPAEPKAATPTITKPAVTANPFAVASNPSGKASSTTLPPIAPKELATAQKRVNRLSSVIEKANAARDRAANEFRAVIDSINLQNQTARETARRIRTDDPSATASAPPVIDSEELLQLNASEGERNHVGLKTGIEGVGGLLKSAVKAHASKAPSSHDNTSSTSSQHLSDPHRSTGQQSASLAIDQWLTTSGRNLTEEQVQALREQYDHLSEADDRLFDAEQRLQTVAKQYPQLAQRVGEQNLQQVEDFYRQHDVNLDPVKIESWLQPNYRGAEYNSFTDALNFGANSGVPYALASDIVAHEYTHRVADNLIPDFNKASNTTAENRAISESLADTIAASITHDWHIGEVTKPGGIRNMSDPSVSIDDYVRREGPHAGAAIPNNAAWRIGTAVGFEQMGDIYVEAMKNHIGADVDFRSLASATWQASVDLYGRTSAQANAVRDAWDATLNLHGDDSLFGSPAAPHPRNLF